MVCAFRTAGLILPSHSHKACRRQSGNSIQTWPRSSKREGCHSHEADQCFSQKSSIAKVEPFLAERTFLIRPSCLCSEVGLARHFYHNYPPQKSDLRQWTTITARIPLQNTKEKNRTATTSSMSKVWTATNTTTTKWAMAWATI